MSTKQGKKRRRRPPPYFPLLKALKVSRRHLSHGFLLLPAVVFKCFRELFMLSGFPSGSSDEFEFDSVDFRLSLKFILFYDVYFLKHLFANIRKIVKFDNYNTFLTCAPQSWTVS